jgi:hypothetical protein
MHNEVVRISLLGRINYFFLGGVQTAIPDVVKDRIVKEEGILRNHTDLFT